MKLVADTNRRVDAKEGALLDAAARALKVVGDVGALDLEALDPVTPAEVASAFPEELWRRRVVQAMVAMTVIDGDAGADELALVESFAAALGIDDHSVRNLERVIEGDLLRLRVDIVRRSVFARQMMRELWQEKGVRGLWELNVARKKGNPDPELAWRYKRLGLLPEGTLGRLYWIYMAERKLAFPGEEGGFLEKLVRHDLTHVLTGYGTDPAGEAQIAAFNAGYKHEDPFAPIFMVLVTFQLGVRTLPVVEPAKLTLDPHALVRAMQRGAAANLDVTDNWDYWPLLDKPIDEARRTLGIGPH
jgi:ubiquinone biosynthesis protein Coq4